MKTINEVLKENSGGLVYGNRVLLPFQAEVLKIVIGSEIITNFSKQLHGAHVRVTDFYTEIYFYDYKYLEEELSQYDLIKLVCVQQDDDIFDFENHIPIELSIESKHKISIKKISSNEIFFE